VVSKANFLVYKLNWSKNTNITENESIFMKVEVFLVYFTAVSVSQFIYSQMVDSDEQIGAAANLLTRIRDVVV
jgi:hypothetical protein